MNKGHRREKGFTIAIVPLGGVSKDCQWLCVEDRERGAKGGGGGRRVSEDDPSQREFVSLFFLMRDGRALRQRRVQPPLRGIITWVKSPWRALTARRRPWVLRVTGFYSGRFCFPAVVSLPLILFILR